MIWSPQHLSSPEGLGSTWSCVTRSGGSWPSMFSSNADSSPLSHHKVDQLQCILDFNEYFHASDTKKMFTTAIACQRRWSTYPASHCDQQNSLRNGGSYSSYKRSLQASFVDFRHFLELMDSTYGILNLTVLGIRNFN